MHQEIQSKGSSYGGLQPRLEGSHSILLLGALLNYQRVTLLKLLLLF